MKIRGAPSCLDHTLFPFFDGLIPEGWLLNVVSRNWKIDQKDRFGLLMVACHDCIGCVIKVIKRYSSRVGLDLSELFLRLVFCFLTGNSDMHLKNFSLMETEASSGVYMLSPAYDLLPVNVIMPEDKEEFALTMRGKKKNLTHNDFLIFAENAGIARKAAENMIRKMIRLIPKWMEQVHDSLLPEDMKDSLIQLIESRAARLDS